jgi:hypothetical protein
VSVETIGPVSITVDDEARRRGAVKKQAVVEGALEVPNDALCSREMRLTGVMHVEAHLLDRVGNVRPDEGEVLESPSQAVVASRAIDGGPHVRGDIGLSVERHGVRLAVAHANTLKDVLSVLLSDHCSTKTPRKW